MDDAAYWSSALNSTSAGHHFPAIVDAILSYSTSLGVLHSRACIKCQGTAAFTRYILMCRGSLRTRGRNDLVSFLGSPLEMAMMMSMLLFFLLFVSFSVKVFWFTPPALSAHILLKFSG